MFIYPTKIPEHGGSDKARRSDNPLPMPDTANPDEGDSRKSRLPPLSETNPPRPSPSGIPKSEDGQLSKPPPTTFQPPPSGKFMTDHTFRVLHSASPSFRLFGYSPYPHSPCSLPIRSPQHVAYDFVFYLVFKGRSSRQEDHRSSFHSERAMPSPSIPPPAHTPSFQPHKSIYSRDI